jgi:hypothetical protein
MSEPIYTFEIPDWTPCPVNALMQRVATRIRRKKEARMLVVAYALNADIPKASSKRRVRLTITAPGRLPDPDGVLKSMLDCLVAARLLVDDSGDWCELGQVKVERGPARMTCVQLEDLAGG